MTFAAPRPYRALRLLGRGGMGEVWEVVQPETQVHYALKVVLRPDVVDDLRFEREAQAMASLNSAHVVRVHSAGHHQGSPYLVQEFLTGGSLADRLREGPLAPGEARQVVSQVALGVAAAHAAGLLHRDLKPDNVLFDEAGSAKVADFGLASREGDVQERLTQTGEILGTPAYMAPEQAVDSSRADARADVYALGAILYASLTGGPPIPAAGRSLLAHLTALQDERPLPPSALRPGLPPDLDALCLDALAKDPAERPPSAAAFLERLRGEAAPPASPRYLLWGGAALALALLSVAVWLASQTAQEPPTAPLPSVTQAAGSPTPTPTATAPPTRTRQRLSTGFNLRLKAWRGRPLSCVVRGREFLVQGGGTLSRWDANTGQRLEVVEAFPSAWNSNLLCDLPGGELLAGARQLRGEWREGQLCWYSPARGVYRAAKHLPPSAIQRRPGGGAVVADEEGGITFFDASGAEEGARRVIFGNASYRPPGRDPIRVMEIRALTFPRPDRLLVLGSPSDEQFDDHFKGSAMTGWALLLELKGSLPPALLGSLESPGAKSLAHSKRTGTFLVGKAVGSIDLLAVRDGPAGPASKLVELRRNFWSPSALTQGSTSWGEVALLPDEGHFLALGAGAGAQQNLLMSCEVKLDGQPEVGRLQLPRRPTSLAVCYETRSALVCGIDGLARFVPFEELGIPAE